MLHIRVLYVGRRAHDPLLEAAEDYRRRLARQARLELVRLRDAGKAAEANAFSDRLMANDWVVALDEGGAGLSTDAFAGRLRGWRAAGRPVAMLIGGADGLDRRVLQRADEVISLSKMTLPHRLALVVLLEQLYRAHTILAGGPYHRIARPDGPRCP